MIQHILNRNKILFWLGSIHVIVFLMLLGYSFFNETLVLGINSMIKPMKFALSIWIFSWTMALILHHLKDKKQVEIYSWVAVISMAFEQIAISFQAFRGELSHFNTSNVFGIVLFSLMGVLILTLTLWTAYITYVFFQQRTYLLTPSMVLSIKIALIYFTIFSLFGGYISGLKGHTIGGTDEGNGLFFLNWNTTYGDLRVAHFFGIHSLQIIPLFGLLVGKFSNNPRSSLTVVWAFSLVYLGYVLMTMIQGLLGRPFIGIYN
jgi:hypothetical protein